MFYNEIVVSDPNLSDDFGYGFAAVAFEIGGDSVENFDRGERFHKPF